MFTYETVSGITAISIVSGFITMAAIPRAMETMKERGIFGMDINKTTIEQRQKLRELKNTGQLNLKTEKLIVPESLGIVIGGVYLCAVVVALLCGQMELARINAAISSIGLMLLLGFVDDALDVRWRYKLVLSMFGVVPLVLSYDGAVDVLVPIQLRSLIGSTTLTLGPWYLVYLGLFCVFCANSINILAGINGIEVGQSLIIAIASALHNYVQIHNPVLLPDEVRKHEFSLTLLMPFISGSFALYLFNKYPSQVFVGDSYTYFAGMTLAVSGIMGHYTKTLMLFFIPQIINFVLSLPQLLKIIHCPRHRVPTWNAKTNKLANSRNGTILNAILMVTGDLNEGTLTNLTLLFQVACCAFGFYVRHSLAGLFFEVVR